MNTATENLDIQFPCEFPIKAIGLNKPTFIDLIQKIIAEHVAIEANQLTEKVSKNGKYRSVTANVVVQNKQQLDDIYRALSSHKSVVMAL